MSNVINVDVDSWKRKEIFERYKDYDDPFFSLCTQLDITNFVQHTKSRRYPFSLSLVYLSLRCANVHRSFRYRINNDQVILLDEVHAAMTVLHEDDYFDYCHFDYNSDFFEFLNSASHEMDRNQQHSTGSQRIQDQNNIIHYSILPWINFSNLSHAHDYKRTDSIPKFVFGKYTELNGRCLLPLSIEVNHALMDGIHVARYLQDFQYDLDHPEVSMDLLAENTQRVIG